MKRIAILLLCLALCGGAAAVTKFEEVLTAKKAGSTLLEVLPSASVYVYQPGCTASADGLGTTITVYSCSNVQVGDTININGYSATVLTVPSATTITINSSAVWSQYDRMMRTSEEVTIYEDPAAATQITQPATADSDGRLTFYVNAITYPAFDILATSSANSLRLADAYAFDASGGTFTTLSVATLNGEIFAGLAATGGSGTRASPYTGWESVCATGNVVNFGPYHYSTATGCVIHMEDVSNEPSETVLRGAGMGATFINVTADVPALKVYGTDSTDNPDVDEGLVVEGIAFQAGATNTGALVWIEEMEMSWVLRDVTIRNWNGADPDEPPTFYSTSKGLYCYHCGHGYLDNVFLRSRSDATVDIETGFHFYNDDGAQRGNIVLNNVQAHGVQNGIKLDASGNSVNNLTLVGFKATKGFNGSPYGTGIELLGQADQTTIINPHIEDFEYGLKATGADGLILLGGMFSECADDDTDADSNGILDSATLGRCIWIYGGIGAEIIRPTINVYYTGLYIEDQPQDFTYKPGRHYTPCDASPCSQIINNADTAFKRELDLGRELSPDTDFVLEATGGGDMMGWVGRDDSGTQEWRVEARKITDGWGLQIWDESDAVPGGHNNLFYWDKDTAGASAGQHMHIDVPLKLGGDTTGTAYEFSVLGDSRFDGVVATTDSITTTAAIPAWYLMEDDNADENILLTLNSALFQIQDRDDSKVYQKNLFNLNVETGDAELPSGGLDAIEEIRSDLWLQARGVHSLPEWPQPEVNSSTERENDQREHKAVISFVFDDGNESALLIDSLTDGSSGELTPVNKTDGTGSSSTTVDVEDPGVAGYLANTLDGTELFRIGQRIKIGSTDITTIVGIVDSNTILIENSRSWSDDDDIFIVARAGLGIIADSLGATDTGRVGSTHYCDATRKDDDGATAAATDATKSVTISGGTFAFSAAEQVTFDGGMIRFCTDAGCTADEATSYEIDDVTGATTLTTVSNISGTKSGVGFYVVSAPTDDCLTAAEVATLASDGHDILYHGDDITPSRDPYSIGNMTTAEIESFIEDGLPILEAAAGVPVEGMVYPANVNSPGGSLVVGRYFDFAMGAGVAHGDSSNTIHNLPPIVTHNLSRSGAVDTSMTLAAAQTQVDNAEAGGGWIIFFGHGTGDGLTGLIADLIDDTIENHPDILILPPSEAHQVMGNRFDSFGTSLGANGAIGRTDWIEGEASANGSTTTIVLSEQTSPRDQAYAGAWIRAQAGGTWQSYKTITNYDGATHTATVDSAFGASTVTGDDYTILLRKLSVTGELGTLDDTPVAVRGAFSIKDDNSPAVLGPIWGIDQIWNTGADAPDLEFLEVGDGGYPARFWLNDDGATQQGLSIGAESDGIYTTYLELGCAEATADSATSKLVAVMEGNNDHKWWILRDGETIWDGEATGDFATCNSSYEGGIQYDDTLDEHYTCDGSNWEGVFTAKRIQTGDAPATCTVGDVWVDTGGATVELCYCQTTNNFRCGTLSTAGPTD